MPFETFRGIFSSQSHKLGFMKSLYFHSLPLLRFPEFCLCGQGHADFCLLSFSVTLAAFACGYNHHCQVTRLLIAGLLEAVRAKITHGLQFSTWSSGLPSLYVGSTRDGTNSSGHMYFVSSFPSSSAPFSPNTLLYSSLSTRLSGVLALLSINSPTSDILIPHAFSRKSGPVSLDTAFFPCFPGFKFIAPRPPDSFETCLLLG